MSEASGRVFSIAGLVGRRVRLLWAIGARKKLDVVWSGAREEC